MGLPSPCYSGVFGMGMGKRNHRTPATGAGEAYSGLFLVSGCGVCLFELYYRG